MNHRGPGLLVLLLSVFFFFAPTPSLAAHPSPHEIGFYCGPYLHSFESEKEYIPTDIHCVYESPTIAGPKIAWLFKGTPGNAVKMNAHGLGNAAVSNEIEVFNTPQVGDKYFVLIANSGNVPDIPPLETYFMTGVGAPPTENYGVLEWTYGPRTPEHFDPVVIIPGILGSWEKNNDWVIDPVTHIYDDLIETFKANGYVEGETLFTFPYDWRLSNTITATKLKLKIEEIRQHCNCSSVDIIAHSMGGLVARQYIQNSSYANDIDQLIFLGTPHQGAPKIYKTWEIGEIDFGGLRENLIMKEILRQQAYTLGFSNRFAYIRGLPIKSIEELLPSYSYILDGSSLREYPDGYPRNTFLENLNSDLNQLLNAGVRLYNFTGDAGAQTLSSFTTLPTSSTDEWEHGEPYQLFFSNGDGTVPDKSSTYIGVTSTYQNTDHSEIVSTSKTQVFQILNNRIPDQLVDGLARNDLPFLFLQLFSPIDLTILAPDGKRLGKDFETDVEINEIAGAFYSGFDGENEYAVIPNPIPGEYTVEVKGTGDGTYTVASSYITATGVAESEISGIASLGRIDKANLELDTTTNSIELISVPSDTQAPSILISSPNKRFYTRLDSVTPDVEVTDESTLAETNYLLNQTSISSTSPLPLLSISLGSSTFSVIATDVFGNATTSIFDFMLGATADSAIADIQRAFQNGWIKKPAVRDRLINEFRTVDKLLDKKERIEASERKKKQQILEQVSARVLKIIEENVPKIVTKQSVKNITQEGVTLINENLAWFNNHIF